MELLRRRVHSEVLVLKGFSQLLEGRWLSLASGTSCEDCPLWAAKVSNLGSPKGLPIFLGGYSLRMRKEPFI